MFWRWMFILGAVHGAHGVVAQAAALGNVARVGVVRQDTRVANRDPTEIYGPDQGSIILRLGNGGAGPTGLLRALAEDFLAIERIPGRVAWIQNITHLTLANLRDGVIDVALTYEPTLEWKALASRWATQHHTVFHDHFVLVGPEGNPAKLTHLDTAAQAMGKIARLAQRSGQPMFLSRDDNSGTNHKERALWQEIGLAPWRTDAVWYVRRSVFPKEALVHADAEGLYTITDRGTWLTARRMLRHAKLYVQGGAQLLNPCHVLLGAHPSPMARRFYHYLTSPRAQTIIANFGRDKYDGQALFTRHDHPEFEDQLAAR